MNDTPKLHPFADYDQRRSQDFLTAFDKQTRKLQCELMMRGITPKYLYLGFAGFDNLRFAIMHSGIPMREDPNLPKKNTITYGAFEIIPVPTPEHFAMS